MAKKKKQADRSDALNELKTLESRWLKDHRIEGIEPIPVKVLAAKAAALVEYAETNELSVSFTDWPLTGAEDLCKMDESSFKKSIDQLLKASVISTSFKIRKTPKGHLKTVDLKSDSEDGTLSFRCMKAGGLSFSDRDEYIGEDEEVSYSEEDISESQSLQNAIANEWLIRV